MGCLSERTRGQSGKMMTMQTDAWQDGDLYEPYVGRWSRAVAATFVDWLEIPAEARWLDVGCGTGALSETVLLRAEPSEVRGVDRSEGFVKYARQHLDDPRFDAQVGDARSLPFDDGSFDAVVSGLVLNFIPDQGGVANELVRVAARRHRRRVRVGLRRRHADDALLLGRGEGPGPQGARTGRGRALPGDRLEKGLGNLFDLAGLTDVRSSSIDVPTIFRDFDDYWRPFLGGQGPAPAYCSSLDEGKRAELRELLPRPVAHEGGRDDPPHRPGMGSSGERS